MKSVTVRFPRVRRRGVVVKIDIDAVRAQLGEPRDFVDTDDAAQADTAHSSDGDSWQDRRLYRDMDNALLAGVLSGIAAYVRVDPVIVRVIFVIVAVGSFGWALLVYALLWFLIARRHRWRHRTP